MIIEELFIIVVVLFGLLYLVYIWRDNVSYIPRPNIKLNPNYGEKTRISVRVVNIHRKTGRYNDYFVITYYMAGHKYRTTTDATSYSAQYNNMHVAHSKMVGNKRTPLIKYLEMFDIKSSVTRSILKLIPVTKNDIDIVWISKDNKELFWGNQIG